MLTLSTQLLHLYTHRDFPLKRKEKKSLPKRHLPPPPHFFLHPKRKGKVESKTHNFLVSSTPTFFSFSEARVSSLYTHTSGENWESISRSRCCCCRFFQIWFESISKNLTEFLEPHISSKHASWVQHSAGFRTNTAGGGGLETFLHGKLKVFSHIFLDPGQNPAGNFLHGYFLSLI